MSNAPWAVGKIAFVITVLEAIAFWFLFLWFYGERIETLRERIQSRDDQITRLESQLAENFRDQNESPQKQEVEQLRSEVAALCEGHPYTIPKEDEVEFVQTFLSIGPHDMEIIHAEDDEDGKARALAKRLSALFVSSR